MYLNSPPPSSQCISLVSSVLLWAVPPPFPLMLVKFKSHCASTKAKAIFFLQTLTLLQSNTTNLFFLKPSSDHLIAPHKSFDSSPLTVKFFKFLVFHFSLFRVLPLTYHLRKNSELISDSNVMHSISNISAFLLSMPF